MIVVLSPGGPWSAGREIWEEIAPFIRATGRADKKKCGQTIPFPELKWGWRLPILALGNILCSLTCVF